MKRVDTWMLIVVVSKSAFSWLLFPGSRRHIAMFFAFQVPSRAIPDIRARIFSGGSTRIHSPTSSSEISRSMIKFAWWNSGSCSQVSGRRGARDMEQHIVIESKSHDSARVESAGR